MAAQQYEFKAGPNDANQYAVTRLPTLTQNHIARRFGSVLIFLGTMKPQEGPDTKPMVLGPREYARAIVTLSSQVAQQDIDYVIEQCLRKVTRGSAGGWAPLMDANGGLMFDDMDVLELNQVLYEVLKWHGLVDFFSAAPSK